MVAKGVSFLTVFWALTDDMVDVFRYATRVTEKTVLVLGILCNAWFMNAQPIRSQWRRDAAAFVICCRGTGVGGRIRGSHLDEDGFFSRIVGPVSVQR